LATFTRTSERTDIRLTFIFFTVLRLFWFRLSLLTMSVGTAIGSC